MYQTLLRMANKQSLTHVIIDNTLARKGITAVQAEHLHTLVDVYDPRTPVEPEPEPAPEPAPSPEPTPGA